MKQELIRASRQIRIDPQVEATLMDMMHGRDTYNDVLRRVLGLDIERRGDAGQERRQAS